jgi:hypothetical protein
LELSATIERVVQRVHPLHPQHPEWLVTTTGGSVWRITRSSERGCCGHPLLGFKPDQWKPPA